MKVHFQTQMVFSFICLTLMLFIFCGCSDRKPCYILTTEKFLDCIARKNTKEIARYSTEITAKLIDRLFQDKHDTLYYEEFADEELCPGFRDVIKNIRCQVPREDGSFDWPKIARDSLSGEGLKVWVWVEYPVKKTIKQYRLRLIRVDDTWLVDLPILD